MSPNDKDHKIRLGGDSSLAIELLSLISGCPAHRVVCYAAAKSSDSA